MIFSAHLIDDGDEIREGFVAHGRIWPTWSKSQESAIEPAVDRPVDHAPTRDGLRGVELATAQPQILSRSLRSRSGEVAFVGPGLLRQ
jgi:hypothetical protein